MANQIHVTTSPRTMGETAVDGLLHGLAAGVAMFVYLLIVSLLMGESVTTLLSHFADSALTPQAGNTPFFGIIFHLGMSATYGVLFGVVWKPLARRAGTIYARLIAGVIYAVALALLALLVLLPVAQSSLLLIPPLHFVIAHVAYGLVLGYLAQNR